MNIIVLDIGASLAVNISKRKTTRHDVPPDGSTHHHPASVLTKNTHPESDQACGSNPQYRQQRSLLNSTRGIQSAKFRRRKLRYKVSFFFFLQQIKHKEKKVERKPID